jgi:hypothetical protein
MRETPAITNAPAPLQKRDGVTAIGLALTVLLAGGLRMAPGVCGGYHDDAIYVSTAEALATGQGYRLIDVPGEPLQTKYPWIYPAILSAVWYFCPTFPANVAVMQTVTLCFAAAAVAAGYLYLVRFGYCTRKIAASAALLCATAPYFLYFGVQTMAEMPFALLTIFALWGVESLVLRPDIPRRAQFAWGVVLALPFLCRTIGATVVVAGVWVVLRSRRPLRWYAAGVAFAVTPWILWSAAGRGIWDQNPIDGYYTDYFGCWSSTGMSMMGRVISKNAPMIAYGSAEMPLEGATTFAGPWLGTGITRTLLIILGMTAWGAMVFDLSKRRALAWMLTVYLAAMLVWSWPPYRFLVPILPFLSAYMLSGCAVVFRGSPSTAARRFARTMVWAAAVAANGGLLVSHAMQTAKTGYPLPKHGMAPVEWSSYETTFAWLRQNAREDDVIASGIDSMMALYTDRRSVRPLVYDPGRLFYGERQSTAFTPDEIAGVLDRYRPRFLVLSPMPGFSEEKPLADAIQRLRLHHPDWFILRYQGADPRFMVFELDGANGPAPEGSGRQRQGSRTVAAP